MATTQKMSKTLKTELKKQIEETKKQLKIYKLAEKNLKAQEKVMRNTFKLLNILKAEEAKEFRNIMKQQKKELSTLIIKETREVKKLVKELSEIIASVAFNNNSKKEVKKRATKNKKLTMATPLPKTIFKKTVVLDASPVVSKTSLKKTVKPENVPLPKTNDDEFAELNDDNGDNDQESNSNYSYEIEKIIKPTSQSRDFSDLLNDDKMVDDEDDIEGLDEMVDDPSNPLLMKVYRLALTDKDHKKRSGEEKLKIKNALDKIAEAKNHPDVGYIQGTTSLKGRSFYTINALGINDLYNKMKPIIISKSKEFPNANYMLHFTDLRVDSKTYLSGKVNSINNFSFSLVKDIVQSLLKKLNSDNVESDSAGSYRFLGISEVTKYDILSGPVGLVIYQNKINAGCSTHSTSAISKHGFNLVNYYSENNNCFFTVLNNYKKLPVSFKKIRTLFKIKTGEK
jgi:hypothetical protein